MFKLVWSIIKETLYNKDFYLNALNIMIINFYKILLKI